MLKFLKFESVSLFCILLQLLHIYLGENHRGNTSADLFVHFVGGGLSGITSATATYPLDLVRTRLAAQVITNYRYLKIFGAQLHALYIG